MSIASMNKRTTTMKLSLCALALRAGLAVQAAAPVITNITMVGATPQFAIQSDLGIANQIQYCTNLSQGWWLALTNVMVAQSPYWFVDVGAPPASQRFYRVAAPATPTGATLIPAGSFTMGDMLDGGYPFYDDFPTNVDVSAFYMDTNLVTYTLWTNVYQWATNHGYSFDCAGSGKTANHPVQTVCWYDMVKWCNARSEKEARVPAYYTNAAQTVMYRTGQVDVASAWVNWSAGYRLPTEAEWEKAARGGLSGQRYPWGNTISENQANYWACTNCGYSYDLGPYNGFNTNFIAGGHCTSPVGYFAPNEYGLYDMAGNVQEWCWDWYGTPYGQPTTTNPTGPASGGCRVFRGGAWAANAFILRCACRGSSYPTNTDSTFGFRCVRGS